MSSTSPRTRGDWFKSSYSGEGGNACVEALYQPGRPVQVRDSKRCGEPGGYPVLAFSPTAWAAFTSYAARD